MTQGPSLLGPDMKPEYGCDAYNLPLYGESVSMIRFAVFWSGLFSHTKNDASLKGLCEIPLTADAAEDQPACAHLEAWGVADA